MSTDLIQKTCGCGKPFETEPDEWKVFEETRCPTCRGIHEMEIEDRRAREREQREREEAERLQQSIADMDGELAGLTPERLRGTSIEDPRFNADLWKAVSAWLPDSENPWLGMVGEPGACKTRIAYLKLRQLARTWIESHKKRPNVEIVTGPAFKRWVMGQYSDELVDLSGWNSGRKAPMSEVARRYLRDYREADLLLFDEIGEKIKPTPAIVESLFDLIDYRHSRNLVTIWTCNSKPEEFCASWPTEFAGPIAGRIIESSTILTA